jgi:hypothetical protein
LFRWRSRTVCLIFVSVTKDRATMTNELTGRQANVIDHALAFPKLSRNRFEAENGSSNDQTWQQLVAIGHATILTDRIVAGKTRYTVTASGIAAIKNYHAALVVDTAAAAAP